MIELQLRAEKQILQHASQEYPRECCGLLVIYNGHQLYVPCQNLSEGDTDFFLSPDDYVKAEERYGLPIAIVHSHPNKSPKPTMADMVGCEGSGLPWIIVGWPSTMIHQMEPSGYVPPIIGRTFCHGVLDCYSLVRDYYKQELGVELKDYPRQERWWMKGEALYLDHYEEEGFRQVPLSDICTNDLLLMQRRASTPNHGAVYVGNSQIVHHVEGRLSTREVYGGYWQQITTHALRHREVECKGLSKKG